jgi:hypothetical protein
MSRDLDEKVALAMGYMVIENDESNGEDNNWLSKDGQNVLKDEWGMATMLPRYSTEREQALSLIDELRDRDPQYWFVLQLAQKNTVEAHRGKRKLMTLSGEYSLAEVICQAVLLVIKLRKHEKA